MAALRQADQSLLIAQDGMRQPEQHAGAAARPVRRCRQAAVRRRDRLHDGQPEARAAT
jgi:hypothetical protein